MNIVVLGPPGSGKSTQARLLAEKTGLTLFSTGEVLRNIAKDPSHKLHSIILNEMSSGSIVDDSIVNPILSEALLANLGDKMVIDGVPRRFSQVNLLDYTLDTVGKKVDFAIFIDTSVSESVKRIISRSTKENRPDDTSEAVKLRVDLYHKETEPVLKSYKSRGILYTVDGGGTVEKIHTEIMSLYNSFRSALPSRSR
ncbi:nucleoside monophosphate kinase [bacterium]|nr:nucleoside monophosphate kinase [bacterium]